jgi:hypothetical protein
MRYYRISIRRAITLALALIGLVLLNSAGHQHWSPAQPHSHPIVENRVSSLHTPLSVIDQTTKTHVSAAYL